MRVRSWGPRTVRRSGAAVALVTAFVWFGLAGTAVAAPSEASFAGKLSLGMIGPFGAVVVALGLLGLAVGLIRHRRRAIRQAQAERQGPHGP